MIYLTNIYKNHRQSFYVPQDLGKMCSTLQSGTELMWRLEMSRLIRNESAKPINRPI